MAVEDIANVAQGMTRHAGDLGLCGAREGETGNSGPAQIMEGQ
jgi:hypothetical protein